MSCGDVGVPAGGGGAVDDDLCRLIGQRSRCELAHLVMGHVQRTGQMAVAKVALGKGLDQHQPRCGAQPEQQVVAAYRSRHGLCPLRGSLMSLI